MTTTFLQNKASFSRVKTFAWGRYAVVKRCWEFMNLFVVRKILLMYADPRSDCTTFGGQKKTISSTKNLAASSVLVVRTARITTNLETFSTATMSCCLPSPVWWNGPRWSKDQASKKVCLTICIKYSDGGLLREFLTWQTMQAST